MKVSIVTLAGIELEAHYEVDITTDPYGTGDSPSNIDVSIFQLSLPRDSVNLIDIVDIYFIQKAEEEIEEIEYFESVGA